MKIVRRAAGSFLSLACTLFIGGAAGCSGTSSSSTASGSSALTDVDGGVDTTVATCLGAYVDCLRAEGSDAAACKSTLLTCASAAPATTADGGTGKGKCGGGHGGLADDGDADDAAIAACLATLETCAAGADTSDVCVGAASTCLAAAR